MPIEIPMTVAAAVAALETALVTAKHAKSLGSIIKSSIELLQRKKVTPGVSLTLAELPADATAEQIIEALRPFVAKSGALTVAAGDDGGGDLVAHDLDAATGDSPTGSGDMNIKSGSGGPHGKE